MMEPRKRKEKESYCKQQEQLNQATEIYILCSKPNKPNQPLFPNALAFTKSFKSMTPVSALALVLQLLLQTPKYVNFPLLRLTFRRRCWRLRLGLRSRIHIHLLRRGLLLRRLLSR